MTDKGDLISREALKSNIDKFIGYLDEDMIYRIKVVIDNAPTVEERPQGEWVKMSDRYGIYYAYNLCGWDKTEHKSNFCPNCGASMKKGGGT